MASSRLDILINAKNNASRELNQVDGDLSRLNQTAGGIGATFGSLTKALGTAAVAFGALQVGRTVVELSQLGNASLKLKGSFDDLARSVGSSADDMLAAMKEASGGMIAETDLIQAANRAMLLGVADSADELEQLLDVAQKRAVAMGLSVSQAFDDLVTGIGRMSPLILDNLGIVTGGEAVFEAYAASLGRTADSLSDAEKKQALLNKVIAESAGLATPPADEFERMNAAIQDAKTALGELFSPAVAVVAQNLADATRNLLNNMEQAQIIGSQRDLFAFGDSITGQAEALQNAINDFRDAAIAGDSDAIADAKQRVQELSGAIKLLGEEYNNAARATGAPLLDIGQLQNGVVAFQQLGDAALDAAEKGQEVEKIDPAARAAAAGWADLVAQIQGSFATFQEIQNAIDTTVGALQRAALSAVGTLGAEQALGIYQQQTSIVEEQNRLWREQGVTGDELLFLNKELETTLSGQIADLTKINTATKAIGGSASTVNKEFSNLESIISGIVSGATGPVAGVDANDLLPREDAINENARRLADIAVNGFKNQDWLGEFAAEAPDIFKALEESGDPQGTAARLLKDFQDGLLPELIDKDKAKELAKRALLGQQNAKALVDEIAGDLAKELGISVAEAKAGASQALGVSSGGSGGGSDAEPITRTMNLLPQIDQAALQAAIAESGLTAAIAVTLSPTAWRFDELPALTPFNATLQPTVWDLSLVPALGAYPATLQASEWDLSVLPQLGGYPVVLQANEWDYTNLPAQSPFGVTLQPDMWDYQALPALAPIPVTLTPTGLAEGEGVENSAFSAGSEFALSFSEGFQQINMAGRINATLQAQLSVNDYQAIRGSAENAGKRYGEMFGASAVGSVSGVFIQGLADILAPIVAERNADGSRTGAE